MAAGERVLICGGRDFSDKRLVMAVMAAIEAKGPIACVIEGGARGADRIGRAWAEWRGLPVIEVPAPWERLGKKAGSVRNQWMLDHAMPTLVVAFPGGVGTADMVRRARSAGVAVCEASEHLPDQR